MPGTCRGWVSASISIRGRPVVEMLNSCLRGTRALNLQVQDMEYTETDIIVPHYQYLQTSLAVHLIICSVGIRGYFLKTFRSWFLKYHSHQASTEVKNVLSLITGWSALTLNGFTCTLKRFNHFKYFSPIRTCLPLWQKTGLSLLTTHSMWENSKLDIYLMYMKILAVQPEVYLSLQQCIWLSINVLTATNVGSLLSMSLSGVLAEYGGWPLVFYFFGACTVVWFIPWLLLAYNSPHDHPRISPEEKTYIISELDATHNKVLVLVLGDNHLKKKLICSVSLGQLFTHHMGGGKAAAAAQC